jgi:hypothetical protein
MADNTPIEWTDAPLDLAQGGDFDKSVMRRPASPGKPFPNVTVALAAVAANACGNDVAGFRDTAKAHRDDVIPRGGRRRAVGAKTVKLLGEQQASFFGHWFDPALSAHCMSQARRTVAARVPISLSSFAVCTFVAGSLPLDICRRQPALTAATPALACRGHRLAHRFGGAGRGTLRAARPADVTATVDAGSVNLEPVERTRNTAAAAGLFSLRRAGNPAPVRRALILQLPHLRGDRTGLSHTAIAGRLLDGIEHNAFPGGAA